MIGAYIMYVHDFVLLKWNFELMVYDTLKNVKGAVVATKCLQGRTWIFQYIAPVGL